MALNFSSKKPLVFYWHAARLEQLAAVTVAVKVIQRRCQRNGWNLSSKKFCKPVTSAELCRERVPEIFLDIVSEVLEPIVEEWNCWINANDINLRSLEGRKYRMIDLLDYVVWTPELFIDHKQTAKKLMRSCKLKQIDKFCLLASYCCEEEVASVWLQLTRKEKKRVGKLSIVDYPLARYWHELLTRRARGLPDGDVGELQRIINEHPNALIYYWESFSEKQLEGFFPIVWYHDERSLLLILPKLTRSQLNRIALVGGDMVICCLASQPKYLEYTLQTWEKICHIVPVQRFLGILYTFGNVEGDQQYRSNLLREVFTMAPKYLRNKLFENDLEYIYPSYLKHSNFHVLKGLKRDFAFLLEVLPNFSPEWRVEYWHKNWQNLIVGGNPTQLNELMQLCLEDERSIAEFKSKVITKTSIADYCEVLHKRALFKELSKFLDFCCISSTDLCI